VPDPETQRVAGELAARLGVVPRSDIPAQEIMERLIYPMVNEAAKILEEGIAYRGSDIDVVWTAGYGFPEHQGGPLFMADRIGLGVVVERLEHYARERGNPFGYWTVSPLLRDLAGSGRRISEWQAA
jgi:3-hydroxyacyl-CoA dehydrogenase